MRLLLDEQLSSIIAVQLRNRGRDVATADEADLAGRPDPDVLAWAASDRRAVVTGNIRDFRPLHVASLTGRAQHYGIVLLPSRHSLRRADLGWVISALDELLAAYPADGALCGREWFLGSARDRTAP